MLTRGGGAGPARPALSGEQAWTATVMRLRLRQAERNRARALADKARDEKAAEQAGIAP